MRIAFFTDIHANHVALKACLNYIKNNGFDGVVFLGDYITDCPYPQKTIELINDAKNRFKTWFVRGNREDYMIKHHDGKEEQNWKYNSANGCLLYTYENLKEEDIENFKQMPIYDVVEIEGCKPFEICHGSPTSTKEYLLAHTKKADKVLDNLKTDYLFCGHTHRYAEYEKSGKKLINCGSIGLNVNFQTEAQFVAAEFADDEWKTSLVSIYYAKDKILKDFEESGIYNKGYHWAYAVAKCIKTGVNYPLLCLNNALELSKKGQETLNETHWTKAAQRLKLNSDYDVSVHLGMPTLFGMKNLEESARLCNELNIRFIEIHMTFPWFQPEKINIDHMLHLMESYDIYYTLHMDNINPCHFNDRLAQVYTETAINTIEVAKKLNAPIINMHLPNSGYISLPDNRVYLFELYKDEYIAKIKSFKDACIEAVGDSNVKISIENTTGYKDFEKEALEILLESPVFCLCFDTGHAENSKSDCEEYIIGYRSEKLAHFHLHDTTEGRPHLILGDGDIDYAKYYKLAKSYASRIVVEVKTVDGLKRSIEALNKLNTEK